MTRIIQVPGSAEWAGGERHLLDLLSRLDRSAFDVLVVCPGSGPLVKRLERMGIQVRIVSHNWLGSLRALNELTGILKAWNPDLVQSHGARSNFYTRLACRRLGATHIATVHNSLFDYPIPTWKKRAYLAIDRALAKHSKVIVCVSESLRQDLIGREHLSSEKVRVIYNGVDTQRFEPSRADRTRLKRTLHLPADCWLVGVVGRMTLQKGHRYFLEAFSRLRQISTNAYAVIVGDGPLRRDLERQVNDMELTETVRFTGVREDIPDVLAGLDLLVLSSVSEGLPYIVLEAFAMETPVVATRVNGVPEILSGEVNYMVPPKDPQALAEAMERFRSFPEQARHVARCGRETVLKRFAIDSMRSSWEALYKELAAGA